MGEIRLLHALESLFWSRFCHWQRGFVLLGTEHLHWQVDRLPNPSRCWTRYWDSNGLSSPYSSSQANDMITPRPIIAVQNTISDDQMSIAMSTVMFSQILSVPLALTIADLTFDSSLKNEVPHGAPGVDPKLLLAAGATGIRSTVPAVQLPGVLKAYSVSVDRVFYLAVGCSMLLFFASFGMGRKDIRKKEPSQRPEAEPGARPEG